MAITLAPRALSGADIDAMLARSSRSAGALDRALAPAEQPAGTLRAPFDPQAALDAMIARGLVPLGKVAPYFYPDLVRRGYQADIFATYLRHAPPAVTGWLIIRLRTELVPAVASRVIFNPAITGSAPRALCEWIEREFGVATHAEGDRHHRAQRMQRTLGFFTRCPADAVRIAPEIVGSPSTARALASCEPEIGEWALDYRAAYEAAEIKGPARQAVLSKGAASTAEEAIDLLRKVLREAGFTAVEVRSVERVMG
ncbi:hypothetical protein [Oricola indica]|uniref:hypothetical protein n=1 Tax=Oricola indica TaxID=2872591 RepID=UPI001CC1096A|nr:hypothetical protein [Oricola indica]